MMVSNVQTMCDSCKELFDVDATVCCIDPVLMVWRDYCEPCFEKIAKGKETCGVCLAIREPAELIDKGDTRVCIHGCVNDSMVREAA